MKRRSILQSLNLSILLSSFSFSSHLPVPPRHPGLAFALEKLPVDLLRRHLLLAVPGPIRKALGGEVRARGQAVSVLGGEELSLGAAEPFDEVASLRGMTGAPDDTDRVVDHRRPARGKDVSEVLAPAHLEKDVGQVPDGREPFAARD